MMRGGGTIVLLCEAIRQRLAEALENTLQETGREGMPIRAPRIVNGFLPPKRVDEEPEHPFVLVRPVEGTLGEGENRVKVQVIIGSYSEEFDGYEYAIIVLQRIMVALSERPIVDRRYVLELPLTWGQPEEQPWPLWQVVLTTDWTIAAPVKLLDEGVFE